MTRSSYDSRDHTPRVATYDDPGQSPQEHISFSEGGDIRMAMIGVLSQLTSPPSAKAFFTISLTDFDELIDIYFWDSRYTEVQSSDGQTTFKGVQIRTPPEKPKGWWP